MRHIVFIAILLLLSSSVWGLSYQPVSFEGMAPLKNGNIIDALTGSNVLYHNNIRFETWNEKTIFLIWQQNISPGEWQWVPGNRTIEKDLVGFSTASVLYLASELSWGTAIPQGTVVANIKITDQFGAIHIYPVQAGIHTAEWSQHANPNHSQNLEYVLGPHNFPPFNWNGKEYLARIRLGERYIPTHIFIEYVNPGTSGGAISISAISFNGP